MTLDEVWYPDLQVVNQRGVSKILPDVVEVDPEGTVTYRQRFFGQFGNPMLLAAFPFDEHDFFIRLASLRYTDRDLVLSNEPFRDRTGLLERPLIADWEVTSWDVRAESYESKMLAQSRAGIVLTFRARPGTSSSMYSSCCSRSH